MTDPLIESLRRAVERAPDDALLRLHLAEQLLAAGAVDDAIAECATVLSQDPTCGEARQLMARSVTPAEPAAGGFDWAAADRELDEIVSPMFVADEGGRDQSVSAWEAENAGVTLADVGGMHTVKDRLEAAFLAPMRNPELRKLYGKSLRGGLLMYGPPGCGKTFLARAVAGELGARFVSVGLADVLDMYVGNSERNIAELFDLVRREAPCVLFLDEIDALGQKRSGTHNAAMRGAVVQLLTELDGVAHRNDGVFVLAATNQPWDVDPALRRPGRLDRTLLVQPPDVEARASVFRYHLQHRPVAGIDLARLAKDTNGFSGADIAHVCETASERALLDSARSGKVRMIEMRDLVAALSEVRPSIGEWLQTARNVVLFADDDGTYADLRTYLKKVKKL
ncbi:tetratricopeptide repeat protein [Mycolicibacterium chlorophenolicum]|uniref:ATP-dependent zinc metalloprotease FtsH n=1 Tax=Mycolicibacterium chlorophenolicum TaxID=37916 RepID=A0A0J6VEK7_9MYCO|nr:tetratricopeptide repeat protein [Mycolicibacterium chlorophenolicum]KMO67973.1 ATP-dependent zinc metalloprotease FtsH [Mycolicibacterium chlorophenolicum]